jgi:hypothetical protein
MGAGGGDEAQLKKQKQHQPEKLSRKIVVLRRGSERGARSSLLPLKVCSLSSADSELQGVPLFFLTHLSSGEWLLINLCFFLFPFFFLRAILLPGHCHPRSLLHASGCRAVLWLLDHFKEFRGIPLKLLQTFTTTIDHSYNISCLQLATGDIEIRSLFAPCILLFTLILI